MSEIWCSRSVPKLGESLAWRSRLSIHKNKCMLFDEVYSVYFDVTIPRFFVIFLVFTAFSDPFLYLDLWCRVRPMSLWVGVTK
jgi:hypothetical protein